MLLAAWAFLFFCAPTIAQIRDIQPASGDVVLEKLGPRLAKPSKTTPTPNDLIPAVQQAILLARQTADPRYLGQAQALIGAQWSSPQASHELLTLQATIEQSRHEFANARKTLQMALSKPSASTSQALLTLATLERVQANYAAAERACRSITEPAAQLYARACSQETASLQGQWDAARLGYSQMLREARQSAQQAWLLSLMAENELHAGQTAAASKLFARSIALDADGYTALAYADTLLEGEQAALALAVLQSQPDSDAVLIRRARAYKAINDPRFAATATELAQRMAGNNQRGNNLGHAREQALYALHVQGDAKAALAHAKSNLSLQREPIDWLIALHSAEAAGNKSEKTKLLQAAAQSGLKDARLK